MWEFLFIIFCVVLLGLVFYRRVRLLGKGIKVSLSGGVAESAGAGSVGVKKPDKPAGGSAPVDKNRVDLLLWKADRHFSASAFEDAEKALVQILALDEGHEECMCKLGLVYLKRDLSSKAEALFRRLLSDYPENSSYLSNLGLALYNQKKFKEAAEAYRRALALDDSRAGRFVSLAQVLYELSEMEEAILNMRRALEIEEGNVSYLTLLAEMYRASGDEEKAREILEGVEQFPRRQS